MIFIMAERPPSDKDLVWNSTTVIARHRAWAKDVMSQAGTDLQFCMLLRPGIELYLASEAVEHGHRVHIVQPWLGHVNGCAQLDPKVFRRLLANQNVSFKTVAPPDFVGVNHKACGYYRRQAFSMCLDNSTAFWSLHCDSPGSNLRRALRYAASKGVAVLNLEPSYALHSSPK